VTPATGILLAAGSSSRLGREKQMLSVRGKTLLALVAEALAGVVAPLLVVLPADRCGADSELVAALAGLGVEVEIVPNPSPEKGLGHSVALAAQRLLARHERPQRLLLALVDQPLVTRRLFERLLVGASGGWAACDYGEGAWGVPAVLPGSELPALAALSGERGARPLLEARRAAAGLPLVAFPGGRLDVDTAADYARLLSLGEP